MTATSGASQREMTSTGRENGTPLPMQSAAGVIDYAPVFVANDNGPSAMPEPQEDACGIA